MNSNIKFKEIQQFRQWWLWVIILGMAIYTSYLYYQQIILGIPVGKKPMSDLGLITYTVFVVCFIAMFYFMALRTEINSNEIRIQFFPFIKKVLPWKDVKKYEVITYDFASGWGIRLGTKYGTVFNIKGKQGLAIEMSSGTKYLIGTQKKEEMEAILNKIKRKP
jgi:hypothetical protein